MCTFAFPPLARPVNRLLSPLAWLFTAMMLAASVSAQTITSAVPNLISYQGRVSNSTGSLVGAGTPVNRTVIFRIWGHQSNSTVGDLLYSEQQTVTISEGEFSVLIGQGTAVTGTPLGYSETAKGPSTVTLASTNVFGGALRYLGVTIDDGTTAADPEVSPRQQLVTSAYAMRAKFAESVGSNGNSTLTVTDAGNIGIGQSSPGFPLTFASTTGDKISLYGTSGNSYGFGIQNSLLQIHSDSSGADVAFGYGSSASMTETMRIKGNGNVGIGTNNPSAKLDVNGILNVFDGGTKTYPAGIASESNSQTISFGINDTRFGTQTTSQAGGFLRLDSRGTATGGQLFQFMTRAAGAASPSTSMVIDSSGNVGVGLTSPTVKLHVNGAVATTSLISTGSVYGSTALQTGGSVTTHTQGAYLEWNKAVGSGMTSLLNQRGTGGGGLSFGEVDTANTVTERMRIDSAGNVGIGTSTPSTKLHVLGGTRVEGNLSVSTATVDGSNVIEFGAGVSGKEFNAGKIGYGSFDSNASLNIVGAGAGTNPRYVRLWDRLGIATSAPRAPIDVSTHVDVTTTSQRYFSSGAGLNTTSSATDNTSIIATAWISSGRGFIAFSDARIKNVIGRSSGSRDLQTLLGIEVTDYRYKDGALYGDRISKKVVAQQVERLFPEAVSRRTDVVPDIFLVAPVNAGWVELATDLKKGERVKVISEKSEEIVSEVLEVAPGRFRPERLPEGNKVFVYGREVDDFRSVDYEAIAMLNVSATQEIKREKDAEIAALRKRVAELEAKDRARDAKLASIEKLLNASQTVMAAPAKTTAGNNGQE
jgi:hypothetical protein